MHRLNIQHRTTLKAALGYMPNQLRHRGAAFAFGVRFRTKKVA
jgi:hypothetical protein